MTNLIDALHVIKKHCENSHCEDCGFNPNTEVLDKKKCMLKHAPCNWQIEQEVKR